MLSGMATSKRSVSTVIVDQATNLVRYSDSDLPWEIDLRVECRDGRLVVTELHLADGIDAESLRRIPIGTIDTAINYSPTITDAFMGASAVQWEDTSHSLQRPRMRLKDVPAAGARGDGFYRSVGELYRWCIGNGVRNPARAIADANAVPVTTVHGWIRDARRRNFLPPARRGKVG